MRKAGDRRAPEGLLCVPLFPTEKTASPHAKGVVLLLQGYLGVLEKGEGDAEDHDRPGKSVCEVKPLRHLYSRKRKTVS
jgi:hypothetical protein